MLELKADCIIGILYNHKEVALPHILFTAYVPVFFYLLLEVVTYVYKSDGLDLVQMKVEITDTMHSSFLLLGPVGTVGSLINR